MKDKYGVSENESRKAEMESAVSEMIVELLDIEYKEKLPQSSIYIANWRDLDNTVTVVNHENKVCTSKFAPNNTWDTLTGIFVALSKATGRKLPDWIYGEKR